MRVGIWERDEGIRTAVEAGLGELAAEVRAGRHPAELAGARLELLTVSPAGRCCCPARQGRWPGPSTPARP